MTVDHTGRPAPTAPEYDVVVAGGGPAGPHRPERCGPADAPQCAAAGRPTPPAAEPAIAADPLSPQGILTAPHTGMRAGRAVDDHLGGDRTALTRYAAEFDTITATHPRSRRTCRGLEHRWPRHAFRHRRHTAGPTDPAAGRANTRPEPIPPPGVPA
ncbi:hypothetical protein [Embleya sp. NPDC005971]|uniref:hypothetical protein n=1 Tax=Embleya sp. NPDC005971 TaxID=3156724 RepID=UPI0033EEBDB9